MSVRTPLSFESDAQRRIYKYVERHGAVTTDELARAIHLAGDRPQSKPARSGAYTDPVTLSPEQLRAAVTALEDGGYLVEDDGRLRVALSASPLEREGDGGAVTIRPAREEDRDGIVDVMRRVAGEGPYVVAENVAEEVERDAALVRANEERSRVFFVATDAPETGVDAGGAAVDGASGEGADRADETAATGDANGEVVGWLHLDAPELESLRHAATLTLGVEPDSRREGTGSHLLEYGLEWAADAGYRKVYQSVPATNERAIEFLETNGWEREGAREEHYCIGGTFVDEVLLATWCADGE